DATAAHATAPADAPSAAPADARSDAPPPAPVAERVPRPPPAAPVRRRRRVPGGLIVALVLGAILIAGGYLATQAVYFVGVDSDGFVTVYRGVPYDFFGVSL